MGTFKHNKKRNTGLVYEFLVRRLGQSMIEKDKVNYARTLEILRKYYSEGSILAEERELFEVVRNTRGVTESAARRILTEVQKHASAMDRKKIDIKKSNLIKESNYAFGLDFFDQHRIPEYRLLASIQMVVDASQGPGHLNESVSKIQLEEGLVQYMTSKGDYTVKSTNQSEIDTLVMKMIAKRFEEKYSKSLIGTQKVLLEKYIRMQVTGDERLFKDYITSECKRISESLDKASTMREIIEDQTMAAKLSEARQNWDSTQGKSQVLEAVVEDVMLFQKLVGEIESDE
jgi:hypothetical protein